MLLKDCKVPDISYLEPKAVSVFLVRSLGGDMQKKPAIEIKTLAVISRLIDKAIYEYCLAHEAMIQEEIEGKLTFEEIENRGIGQPMYFLTIVNHLENCINAVTRVLKTIEKNMPSLYTTSISSDIRRFRNVIEHIEDKIYSGVQGNLMIGLSEDALVAKITNKQIRLDKLAEEIINLHRVIVGELEG